MPCIHLDVALLARLMTQCSDHKISPSDVTDFEAMATYLPYCDAYITDQLAANVARSIDVNVNFGCALFDAGKQGVSDLIGFLKEKLAGSP